MNVNRNYSEMQLEGHPLAPAEVDVTNRQLDRFRELVRRGKGRREFDDDCSYEVRARSARARTAAPRRFPRICTVLRAVVRVADGNCEFAGRLLGG